ncbi:hypothetical protein BC834DRAFT_169366 [Gloeopeniophorella convolvens]|nr:hypothetical protein BC834DRAFT_169366 [Gloeopeniophorella convolvens]
MAGTRLDLSVFVGLFMESVLYGVHLIVFDTCLPVLLRRTRMTAAEKPYLVTSTILLLLFGTLHIAFALRHALDAFLWSSNPTERLLRAADPIDALQWVFFGLQTMLGDAILIYRCYVIYGRRKSVIAAPFLVWICGNVNTALVLYILFTMHSGNRPLGESHLQALFTSCLSITVVINVFVNGLMVMAIWRVQRDAADLGIAERSQSSSARALRRATRIIIESGVIYTIFAFLFFVLNIASNNFKFAIAACTVQIIGIAFDLIIVRVDAGQTSDILEEVYQSKNTNLTSPMAYAGRRGRLNSLSFAITSQSESTV